MVVDFSVTDGVAEIVLNDPAKLNALDEQALADLGAAFDRARVAEVRAVILRGEGVRSAPGAMSRM